MGALNVNAKRFRKAMLIGFFSLFYLIAILFACGNVYALQLSIGDLNEKAGFMVEADEIRGDGFGLWLTSNDVNPSGGSYLNIDSSLPMPRILMDHVKIWGLRITKDIDLSSYNSLLSSVGLGNAATMRLIITADTSSKPVVGTGLKQDVTAMSTNLSELYLLKVVDGELRAMVVYITDAKLKTHRLKLSSISIPGLQVQAELYDAAGNKIAP